MLSFSDYSLQAKFLKIFWPKKDVRFAVISGTTEGELDGKIIELDSNSIERSTKFFGTKSKLYIEFQPVADFGNYSVVPPLHTTPMEDSYCV
jgi:hypothetical protein